MSLRCPSLRTWYVQDRIDYSLSMLLGSGVAEPAATSANATRNTDNMRVAVVMAVATAGLGAFTAVVSACAMGIHDFSIYSVYHEYINYLAAANTDAAANAASLQGWGHFSAGMLAMSAGMLAMIILIATWYIVAALMRAVFGWYNRGA